jgi:hypothetical protein
MGGGIIEQVVRSMDQGRNDVENINIKMIRIRRHYFMGRIISICRRISSESKSLALRCKMQSTGIRSCSMATVK